MADRPPIAQRALGRGGLRVPAIGLGCMGLSGVYGEADDAISESLIHRAVDMGVTHLDSSDMYGWGHNETLVGRALRGIRDKVILVTKFGQIRRETGGNGVDGRPEYVQQACEASLKRLGVEMIDLWRG
jgi:aryl-alcohol dehydrogenase-like predicted oxidoreductase